MWNKKGKKEQFICSGKTPEQVREERKCAEEADRYLKSGENNHAGIRLVATISALMLPFIGFASIAYKSEKEVNPVKQEAAKVMQKGDKEVGKSKQEVQPEEKRQTTVESQSPKKSNNSSKTDIVDVKVKDGKVTSIETSSGTPQATVQPSIPTPTEEVQEQSSKPKVNVNTTINVKGNVNVNVNTTVNVQ